MNGLFRHILQLKDLTSREQLRQLVSRRWHPYGLGDARAAYINSRVRLLALLFALLTPLWIPVDYFILEWQQFQLMTVVRLLFSLVLLLLAGVTSQQVNIVQSHWQLVLLMVLPALFHLVTQAILHDMPPNDLLICYSFLPFLIIVMHCIFPLTLLEGVGLASLTVTLLSLDELFAGTLFSFSGLASLWLMCLIMGVAIWAQLSQLQMKLQLYNEATTDPLTGLLNRRTLMKQLNHLQRQLLRSGRPVSLLMVDLDHFKSINDRFGHHAGDRVIQRFAKLLQQQARGSDYLARFGGEEFLAVLPDTRPQQAQQLAERILQGCREQQLEVLGETLTFTTSVGIGQLRARETIESSLSQADAALYQAKQQGRDRAVLASTEPPEQQAV